MENLWNEIVSQFKIPEVSEGEECSQMLSEDSELEESILQ